MAREERRDLRYTGWNGLQKTATGENVRPVKDGFVVVISKTRIFIPMNRVIDYTYDVDDITSRNHIEGIVSGTQLC